MNTLAGFFLEARTVYGKSIFAVMESAVDGRLTTVARCDNWHDAQRIVSALSSQVSK